MDLRVFFQKVKEAEQTIAVDPAVVISLETSDGGRAGTRTEVSRALAAKLIVEGRARLASDEETAGHKASEEAIRQRAEEQALRGKVMINLVPQSPAAPIPAPSKEPKRPTKE